MATINAIGSGKPIEVAFGFTADASVTAYAPLCGGVTSTSSLQSASTGQSTSGFVLTSNGSSALPSFQAAASAGTSLSLIQTQDVSAATTLVFTTGINNTTYTNYLITVCNLVIGTASDLLMEVSDDGGGTWKSTDYLSGATKMYWNDATTPSNSNSTAAFMLINGVGASTVPSSSATFWFTNIPTGTGRSLVAGESTIGKSTGTAGRQESLLAGWGPSTTVITGLRFKLTSGGTMTSGKFSVYGLKQ